MAAAAAAAAVDNDGKKAALVQQFLQTLVRERPETLATPSSFHRLCAYEALEIFGLQFGTVWAHRRRERVTTVAKFPQCRKHRCGLTGGCECCSDPWCSGPNCEECGSWKICRHAVDEGDVLFAGKETTALCVLYTRPAATKIRAFPRQ